MTFRVDDLLVSVFPEHLGEQPGCAQCSKCTDRTGTQSPCDPSYPNSENCPPCNPDHPNTELPSSNRAKPRAESWRDEQLATLSRELEVALSR